VLQLREIDLPDVDDDDVLVRVVAAGVDRGAWHLMTGQPFVMRVMGFGVRAPKVHVPGTNLAGVVDRVGPRVDRFRPGDEVFGTGRGAFAEFARAGQSQLASMPAGISFEQAAVVPHGGLAALQALRDRARIHTGTTVLVVGASGAVGCAAVQIAKVFGAHVTGVCSSSKVAMVQALGADRVVDYTHERFTDGGERYDVIVDTGGNTPLSDLRGVLADHGTLVIVGGESGGRWFGMGRQLGARLLSPLVHQDLVAFLATDSGSDLLVLNRFIECGSLTPLLERVYPLDEAPEALRHLEAGTAKGRIALRV
jgi:NADPH:quinone reductase-like Zn-dependent oxidoreductase